MKREIPKVCANCVNSYQKGNSDNLRCSVLDKQKNLYYVHGPSSYCSPKFYAFEPVTDRPIRFDLPYPLWQEREMERDMRK